MSKLQYFPRHTHLRNKRPKSLFWSRRRNNEDETRGILQKFDYLVTTLREDECLTEDFDGIGGGAGGQGGWRVDLGGADCWGEGGGGTFGHRAGG